MKRIGRVDIPQEAFLAVLEVGEGESDLHHKIREMLWRME